MQQIERYGVIALVFFLVTIVAVSFWGDSKSPGFWSRLTGRAKKETTADSIVPPPSTTDVAQQSSLPLNNELAQPGAVVLAGDNHGGAAAPAPTGAPTNNLLPEPGTSPSAQPAGNLGVVNNAGGAGTPGASTPTPMTTPTPAPSAGSGEYVVQKGDSLALIAKRTLGKESRWNEIVALNPGLNPKNLKVGARLTLPSGAAPVTVAKNDAPLAPTAKKSVEPAKEKSVAKAPEAKKRAPAGTHAYTVQKGDTFKAIARRELGDESRWKELAALNPGVDAGKLSVGQTLRLPTGADRPALVASAAPVVASNKPRVR